MGSLLDLQTELTHIVEGNISRHQTLSPNRAGGVPRADDSDGYSRLRIEQPAGMRLVTTDPELLSPNSRQEIAEFLEGQDAFREDERVREEFARLLRHSRPAMATWLDLDRDVQAGMDCRPRAGRWRG